MLRKQYVLQGPPEVLEVLTLNEVGGVSMVQMGSYLSECLIVIGTINTRASIRWVAESDMGDRRVGERERFASLYAQSQDYARPGNIELPAQVRLNAAAPAFGRYSWAGLAYSTALEGIGDPRIAHPVG